MSTWREQEWRSPRKREIVHNEEGDLGEVTRSYGNILDRRLDIADDRGSEVWKEEEATRWWVVTDERADSFRKKQLENIGLTEGGVCCISGDTSLPFRIEAIGFNGISNLSVFYLRDMRQFQPEFRSTTGTEHISVPDIGIPPDATVFSSEDSGLKYRIELQLIEKEREGWAPVGSPWEFLRKEDAIAEIESWRCRMKARRIAAAISAGWKPTHPAWAIEIDSQDNLRVSETSSFLGAPAIFPTAYHAARGMNMMSAEEWKKALSSPQDIIEL